jgi:prepilin-type N-terminal cleavage/methylation domain-containing protein
MKRKEGFTLIELLVAVLFFAIATTSIAMFYASNSRRILDSEKTARMEIVAERAYETFKGKLMERMYEGGAYSQLVFDSIWEYHNAGDTVFTAADNIKGILFNSDIVIDSFAFDTTKVATKDDSKSFSSGSRIWATVVTKNLSDGDSIKMQTIFTHHR